MNIATIIIISGLLIVPFWIRNVMLYRKSFSDSVLKVFNLRTIQQCNALYGIPGKPIFIVSHNFIDHSVNLITKYIFFIIILLISHFTEVWWLTQILLIFVIIDWSAFKIRRNFYYTVPTHSRDAFTSIYKACICGPLYQTLLYILVDIVYIFEI